MIFLIDHPYLVFFGLAAALLVCLEIGRMLGNRLIADTGSANHGSTSAIDGAVFALLGLLLAFTFSGAASRFDTRRELIVTEANAIGTAYLRIDVAPAEMQPALRAAFKRYVAARIDTYRNVRDIDEFKSKLAGANAIQKEIWELAVAAGRRPDALPAANMLLLPALNDMIDITTTRAMATQMHPPFVIFGMLLALALSGAVLAGHGLAGSPKRDWLHMLSFALVMSLALFLILDMEFPRLGYITVDEFERTVIEFTRGG
jgi:putative Ca2+/H+ antiporter (TMEM165/GDT1 family)